MSQIFFVHAVYDTSFGLRFQRPIESGGNAVLHLIADSEVVGCLHLFLPFLGGVGLLPQLDGRTPFLISGIYGGVTHVYGTAAEQITVGGFPIWQ